MFLMIEVILRLGQYRVPTGDGQAALDANAMHDIQLAYSHIRILAYVSHAKADRLWSGRRHADARGSGSEDDVLAQKFFRAVEIVQCCFYHRIEHLDLLASSFALLLDISDCLHLEHIGRRARRARNCSERDNFQRPSAFLSPNWTRLLGRTKQHIESADLLVAGRSQGVVDNMRQGLPSREC